MSYCKEFGKDKVIFLSEDDASKPSTVEFTVPPEEPVGLVTKEGDVNWNCPCIGSMAIGPCGVEFREAFGCFHYSEAEPKGSDCLEKFMDMQMCMKDYPDLYGNKDPMDVEEDEEEILNEKADGKTIDKAEENR